MIVTASAGLRHLALNEGRKLWSGLGLIAVVTLGQLPVGPSVGAAAAVLILGSDGWRPQQPPGS